MAKKMTAAEREARIQQEMQVAGLSREHAEFAVAIEAGDIPGDVIPLEPGENPDGNHALWPGMTPF